MNTDVISPNLISSNGILLEATHSIKRSNRASDSSSTLSIVIASIGRPCLFLTLRCISHWSKPPDEVIVVLPKGSKFLIRPADYKFKLHIFVAPDVGQVSQRIHGFSHAKCDLVMQLDDDVLIDYLSYCEMQSVLEMHSDAVASPIFVDIKTGNCIFGAPVGTFAKAKDAITSLIVGSARWPAKMGKISRAGIPYGVNRECMTLDFLEVEWQSGGCVLHHRRNLELSNFYPFSGRAALEDLFHSFLLRSKKLKLIMCKNATCQMESVTSVANLKSVLHEYRVLREYVRLAELSLFRLRLWLLASIFRLYIIRQRNK
jgi:hypothetical protein